MAEVLGVVASGIAVTQGAQTLGQAVLCLSRLWREVKDVPETIQNALDELELAGKILAAIETELECSVASNFPDSTGGLTSIQCLTIQRCRQVHRDLSTLVDDLAADITSARRRKRLLAKAQVILKKELLESYEKRLQKALRFLDSAVQLHLASSIKQQPKLIAAEITNVWTSMNLLRASQEDSDASADEEKVLEREEGRQFPAPTGRTPKNVVLRGKRKKYSNALLRRLSIQLEEFEEQAAGVSKTKSYRIHISFPRWLLSKAWDIQVSLACSGWTTHFRQYVVLPYKSQVFDTVRFGTKEQLFRLFDDGLASPYSMDEYGLTLLHWAMSRHYEFVAPLVQIGLDDFFLRRSDWDLGHLTPCDIYLGSAEHQYGSGQDGAIHQLLLSHGVYDGIRACPPPWEDEYTMEPFVVSLMIRSIEVFESMLTNVFPNFYQWPLETRVDMVCLCCDYGPMDPRAFVRFLHPDGRLRSLHVACRGRLTGLTVFEALTSVSFQEDTGYRWRRSWPGSRPDPFLDRKWKDIRFLIQQTVSLVELNELSVPRPRTGYTLLVSGVLGWGVKMYRRGIRSSWHSKRPRGHWPWKRLLREGVREWLDDLREGGHDLEAYGKAEMARFQCQSFCQSLDWPPEYATGSGEGPYRWKGFRYGPRPRDWDLIWEWNPAVEEFVGDFWDRIENPPLVVPGAWVEDNWESPGDQASKADCGEGHGGKVDGRWEYLYRRGGKGLTSYIYWANDGHRSSHSP